MRRIFFSGSNRFFHAFEVANFSVFFKVQQWYHHSFSLLKMKNLALWINNFLIRSSRISYCFLSFFRPSLTICLHALLVATPRGSCGIKFMSSFSCTCMRRFADFILSFETLRKMIKLLVNIFSASNRSLAHLSLLVILSLCKNTFSSIIIKIQLYKFSNNYVSKLLVDCTFSKIRVWWQRNF